VPRPRLTIDGDVILESRTRAIALLDLDLDLTHPDLNLIFKVFLQFSLRETPDSQSEILNHLL